jgi:amino acid transporter
MPNESQTQDWKSEEKRVEAQSAVFKKELGLRDLVLTQIVFVVGSSWVGTAAKLGSSQTVYWLLAILLFYLPVASVVIYLNRIMPLEGGLYQWAKAAFNDFVAFMVAWNLWVFAITILAGIGLVVTTNISYAIGPAAAWMRNTKWVITIVSCVLVFGMIAAATRGLGVGKWVHNAGGIMLLITFAALILMPLFGLVRGNVSDYHPFTMKVPHLTLLNVNVYSKLALGALTGFEYIAILAGETRAPARKGGELDNHGSHFCLALHWAQALAAQGKSAALQARFKPLAETLTGNEARINAELIAAQGKPVDIGGYYLPDPARASAAMRPSATLNAALAAL